jgi:hypothetical protein
MFAYIQYFLMDLTCKQFMLKFTVRHKSLFEILNQIRNEMIRLRNKSLLIHNTFFGNQKHGVRLKTTQEHLKVCRTLYPQVEEIPYRSIATGFQSAFRTVEEDITVLVLQCNGSRL